MLGIVMEQSQLLHAGRYRVGYGVVEGAVTPTALPLVLGHSVLRLANQQVGATSEFPNGIVLGPSVRLVIGQVYQSPAAVLQPESETAAGVVHRMRAEANIAEAGG